MDKYIVNTKNWVEKVVIGLNLCPFVKPVFAKNQLKFVLSEAKNPQELTEDLVKELVFLSGIEGDDTETTVLIHPFILQDFGHYIDYLEFANDVIYEMNLEGIFQIASFHPHYQFAGTNENDITNFTNRSPYPTLHLIREASIDRAVAAFPEAEAIFEVNMVTLNQLGLAGWKALEVGPTLPQNEPDEKNPS